MGYVTTLRQLCGVDRGLWSF